MVALSGGAHASTSSRRRVVLSRDDRRRHIHVIGKTGTGKTNLLKTLIFDDLMNGLDFALIDPLGGLASAVVDAVPPERNDSTIYWDPGGDLEHVVGFNPLDRIPVDHRHLVADHVLNAFLHVWGNGLEDTPRLAYVLYSGLRLLLDNPGSTLLGLPRLLTDDDYRQALLAHCTDVVVRGYFENEFGRYDDRFRAQVIGPIQTRVGMLLSPPVLRNIIGQPRSTICIAKLMNERGSADLQFFKRTTRRDGCASTRRVRGDGHCAGRRGADGHPPGTSARLHALCR